MDQHWLPVSDGQRSGYRPHMPALFSELPAPLCTCSNVLPSTLSARYRLTSVAAALAIGPGEGSGAAAWPLKGAWVCLCCCSSSSSSSDKPQTSSTLDVTVHHLMSVPHTYTGICGISRPLHIAPGLESLHWTFPSHLHTFSHLLLPLPSSPFAAPLSGAGSRPGFLPRQRPWAEGVP